MKIHNLFHGGYASNCYYLTDDSERYAVVIDPSVPPSEMRFHSRAELCAVLLTHTHFDHMIALEAWRATGAPVLVPRADSQGLNDPAYNVSRLFGVLATYPQADRLLGEGDEIVFGDEKLMVWMTPGHTQGSCCYLGEGIVFTGDTIFADGGIGRYDFPGASYDRLMQSLDRLLSLDPDTELYPGHGAPTRVSYERRLHN